MDGDTPQIRNHLRLKVIGIQKKKLGVCADWFVGPRLESGWISAQNLFKKISS